MSHYVPLSILELIGIHLPLPPEVPGLKGCSITPGFFKQNLDRGNPHSYQSLRQTLVREMEH